MSPRPHSRSPRLAALLLALCLAAPASAQWATFSRQSPYGSQVALDLGITVLPDVDDIRFLRVDLYTQLEVGGGAVYATIPWGVAAVTDGADEGAPGNIELGGFYDFVRGSFGITAIGGLVLPTAAEDALGIATNLAALLPRTTDPVSVLPESLGFRFGASPRFETRYVVLRGDLGVDVGIPVGSRSDDLDTAAWVRLNAGLGLRASAFMLTAEFVNTAILTDNGPSSAADRFVHTAGFTLSYSSHWADALLGMVFPLDEALRGEALAVTLGVTVYPDTWF